MGIYGEVLKENPMSLEESDRKFFQGVFSREDKSYRPGEYMKPHKVAGDAGGLTKYGITEKAYPGLDIANLTEDKAIDILKKENLAHQRYRWGGSEGSKAITYKLTDIGFNAGPRITNEIMQLAINDMVNKEENKLKVDATWSKWNPKTMTGKTDAYYRAIIEQGGEKRLMDRIIHHTQRFYSGEKFLTKTLSKQDVNRFGRGWTKRAKWNPLND